jgi:hypothetical protein
VAPLYAFGRQLRRSPPRPRRGDPSLSHPTISTRGIRTWAPEATALELIWRVEEPDTHDEGLTGRARHPGGDRVVAAGECWVSVRRPVLAQLRWFLLCWDWRGLAGFGGTRDRLCRTLCSVLPLLAGSRAEGVPSYPNVRSGLSGGGGEAAACAAITRETALSCHQLPSRGVLRRCACWRRPGATSGSSGQQPLAGAPQTHPLLPTLLSQTTKLWNPRAQSVGAYSTHTRPRCGACEVLAGSPNPFPIWMSPGLNPSPGQPKLPVQEQKHTLYVAAFSVLKQKAGWQRGIRILHTESNQLPNRGVRGGAHLHLIQKAEWSYMSSQLLEFEHV